MRAILLSIVLAITVCIMLTGCCTGSHSTGNNVENEEADSYLPYIGIYRIMPV